MERSTADGATEQVIGILAGLLPPGTEVTPGSPVREFGLESLAVTRLWFELRTAFGVDVPLTRLRDCATPADIAGLLAADGESASAGLASPGPAGTESRFAPFPLTDMQQAYLIGKSGDNPVGCHVYREFEVPEGDADRLAATWRLVVERHDMLRAVIRPDGRQQVRPSGPDTLVPVPILAGDGDLAGHLAAVRDRLACRRYPPGAWPMHAVEITAVPDGRVIVGLSIDAMIIDGHGLAVLLRDWWRLYQGLDLPGPVPPARDYLVAVASERPSADDLEYWAARLDGLPAGPVLPGEPGEPAGRPAAAGPHRTALTAVLGADAWTAAGRLARAWAVSPTSIVLTLFAEAFAWHGTPGPFTVVLTASSRGRLPAGADAVVGPFTSSIVAPLPGTLDVPLRAAAQRVHKQLWADLEHAAVSGVAALRRQRARDRSTSQPPLPVVFTSMLGVGPAWEPGDFARRVSYAASQTTGVTLDHQMHEQDGTLRIRWDVIEAAFPPGAVRAVFATFLNALEELPGYEEAEQDGAVTRPMNELQQAYFVPRVTACSGPWDGCQVYHSFGLADLDLARLESAWLRLVGAHEALRTVVGHDGRLHVRRHVPSRRHIPVHDLAGADHTAFLAQQRDTMAGRPFPLGRGPQSDVRVTIDSSDPEQPVSLHLTTDLTILDGRSIHFVVRELMRLYVDPGAAPRPSAAADGSRASRDDYLAARRSARHDQALAGYWRQRVAALPPGPTLPPATDQARVRHEAVVDGWPAVREMARQAGLAPDDLLCAALTQVLGRALGAPFSVTVVRWTEPTAALRPGEYTALSWLTLDHPDLPLPEQAARFRAVLDQDRQADAVEGLGELRRRVMRERRDQPFELPVVYTSILDLSGQPLPPGIRLGPWLTCTPDVALDCVSIDEGNVLRIYWDVLASQFPAGEPARWFGEYRDLVRGLAAGPTWEGPAPAESPGRLSDRDRRVILEDWSGTDAEYPVRGPVHLLFEGQARIRPDAVAVRWTGGVMTYVELDRRAGALARVLRGRGVAPGTGVGISVPRGPQMAVAVFGVLKAGGFYVPLEPSLPPGRAGRMIEDVGVSLVITTSDRHGWPLPGTLSAIDADLIPDQDVPVGEFNGTDMDDLAYVIFTSGSTGRPKGVAVTHRPLSNLLDWCYRTHGFGPADTGLSVTSLGFDLSVWDLLGLLGCGASVYIADEAEQRDPGLLLDILLREPITFWNSAPTTLNQMAPLFAGRAGQPGTGNLRLVYLSGDYTPLPLPGQVRRLFPGARIVSLGGATEATVWSNFFEVGDIDPAWRSIPYGRPIDNCRYYICDERMEPCPPGAEGDLYIGGVCLSAGYHRQPELTAERFIQNPFGPGRLYRTGDRASFFPDGTIFFLGRADGQVKIRGFRVETAEVEHRLRGHRAVEDAVVLARPARGRAQARGVRGGGRPGDGRRPPQARRDGLARLHGAQRRGVRRHLPCNRQREAGP